ncbi:hypothetical protein AMTR_s00017p00243700 [Amborella trichopoda]|uniref:Uncharacterized protein n=1 Tax=Amborella trichopoda TaxID=13333 RepID=W1PNK9_AMBTC|nr:hypothetical protein AMTR_s00017p00243700 [Amborella trichopoda]
MAFSLYPTLVSVFSLEPTLLSVFSLYPWLSRLPPPPPRYPKETQSRSPLSLRPRKPPDPWTHVEMVLVSQQHVAELFARALYSTKKFRRDPSSES